MVNRLIAKGRLTDSKYHPIHVARVCLDRDLDYGTKLDRRPGFLEDRREYGKTKARWFLKERHPRDEGS